MLLLCQQRLRLYLKANSQGGRTLLILGQPVHDYDPRAEKYPEDNHIVNLPFAVVADGVSEPHSKHNPQAFIKGGTLGQLASESIVEVFGKASLRASLSDLLLTSNLLIRSRQRTEGIPYEIGRLAGATFAAAKVGDELTEIITTGDSFALVARKDGSITLTENQTSFHDNLMHSYISKIMSDIREERAIEDPTEEQLEQIREEMWSYFYPIMKHEREKRINKPDAELWGYGLLNGDPPEQVQSMWQRLEFPTEEIETLLLFTDGFIPTRLFSSTDPTVAALFHEMFKRGGAQAILTLTRSAEVAFAQTSHVTHAEATVIPFSSRYS